MLAQAERQDDLVQGDATMTHVHYVNCEKWKKVIGIILWIGATIGLAFGIYGLVSNATFESGESCFTQQYIHVEDGTIDYTHNCYSDSGFGFGILWTFALIGNVGNFVSMWIVANRHYKWLEIRCGVKPKTGEEK